MFQISRDLSVESSHKVSEAGPGSVHVLRPNSISDFQYRPVLDFRAVGPVDRLHSASTRPGSITVGNHEIIKIFSEGVVDKVLKRAGSIAKAKRHNLIFIKSISTAEGCFLFFPSSDPKVIVSISHIESGEVFCFAQEAKQLADKR